MMIHELDKIELAVLRNEVQWIPGYPPGDYYEGMENDFEVYFSPGGAVWHRPRTVQQTQP